MKVSGRCACVINHQNTVYFTQLFIICDVYPNHIQTRSIELKTAKLLYIQRFEINGPKY